MEKAVEEAKEHHEGKVGWPKSVEPNCLKIGVYHGISRDVCWLSIFDGYIAIRYILH